MKLFFVAGLAGMRDSKREWRARIMSDYRHGYVKFKSSDYKVTWHPISKEVYVYWRTDKYAGKAYDLQGALDIAISWLNSHAR